MAMHNDLGKLGEEIAKAYLEKKAYEVLDENWIYGKAEIDLIVYKNRTLIFVEVKARSSVAFGQPEDFVDKAKQRQMETAANKYIELMGHQNEIRFDIVAITFKKDKNYTLNHIKDAFWPEN
ncbi:YraN family protein [Pedobacter sp. MW01-1-1]|uniref:YraN family protein n=1 Tax=Pedobacter sp. MW01-1-1 TaxID=3383027 RepID=UPI003FEF4233